MYVEQPPYASSDVALGIEEKADTAKQIVPSVASVRPSNSNAFHAVILSAVSNRVSAIYINYPARVGDDIIVLTDSYRYISWFVDNFVTSVCLPK